MYISVIIPAHNPDPVRLQRVLKALQVQTLANSDWEVLLVDSASEPALQPEDLIKILPQLQVLRLSVPGLTTARLAGVSQARGEFVVFVDDDNEISRDYLELAVGFMNKHPQVAALGGRIVGEFPEGTPRWVHDFQDNLAIRDFGKTTLVADCSYDQYGKIIYPEFAPVGAGVVLRKQQLLEFAEETGQKMDDRTGASLSSSGDNDIIFFLLIRGWQVSYFPALSLTHIIPAARTTRNYLARLRAGIFYSWVLVLNKYNSCRWESISLPGMLLRMLKAWFVYQAWQSPANYVHWRGACGQYRGLCAIGRKQPFTAGRAWYLFFHYPIGLLRAMHSAGPLKFISAVIGRRNMQRAALRLTPSSSKGTYKAYFLTGDAFWYQTSFCAATLIRHTPEFIPVFCDDGSLKNAQIRQLKKLFPQSIFFSAAQIQSRLEAFLPASKYPVLRSHSQKYLHLKKLCDLHACSDGSTLVLDSDMLFWGRAEALLDWAKQPNGLLHMRDTESSYGYSQAALEKLAGASVPGLINVGVCGLVRDQVNWAILEEYCKALLENYGSHYCLEQALVALLGASMQRHELPPKEYIVKPEQAAVVSGQGILQHYVQSSKLDYFTSAWPRVV